MAYIFSMTQISGGDWLILKEAAAVIGISAARLSVVAKAGRIPHKRMGRQVIISRADAEAYRDSPRKPGRPPTKAKRKR